jgi:hypothetical protein
MVRKDRRKGRGRSDHDEGKLAHLKTIAADTVKSRTSVARKVYTGDGRHASPLFFEEGEEEEDGEGGGRVATVEAARPMTDKGVSVGVDDKEERGTVGEARDGSTMSGGIMSMVALSIVYRAGSRGPWTSR